jgi:hypothetical protein
VIPLLLQMLQQRHVQHLQQLLQSSRIPLLLQM